jgi:hypothetical protein
LTTLICQKTLSSDVQLSASMAIVVMPFASLERTLPSSIRMARAGRHALKTAPDSGSSTRSAGRSGRDPPVEQETRPAFPAIA